MSTTSGARLLVVGTRNWHDGDAVRSALRFARESYDVGELLTFGGDGAEGLARLAWTGPVTILEPDWETHRYEARLRCLEQEIADRGITVAIGFVGPQGGGNVRKVLRRARELDVPAWRWSLRLRFPVPAGADSDTPHWRRLLTVEIPEAFAEDPELARRARTTTVEEFVGAFDGRGVRDRLADLGPRAATLAALVDDHPGLASVVRRTVAERSWRAARRGGRAGPVTLAG